MNKKIQINTLLLFNNFIQISVTHAYFYLLKQFIEKLLSGLIRVLILRQCISLLMVYPDVCKFT